MLKIFTYITLTCSICLTSTMTFAANTTIYESKDAKGRLVLSDMPLKGSKIVKLSTDDIASKPNGYIAWKTK